MWNLLIEKYVYLLIFLMAHSHGNITQKDYEICFYYLEDVEIKWNM